MKKSIIATLLLFCQFVFAEYAVVDKIVYDVNFDDLTAKVVNFQTSTSTPCDVTIPGTIRYKNDTYTVTCLSYYAFDYDAMSEYQVASMIFGADLASYGLNSSYKKEQEERKFQYDYNEARANIEHLNLPNTLTIIRGGAFIGMRRLKALTIPASVQTFWNVDTGNNLLNGRPKATSTTFPRLENITILGTPTCTVGSSYDGTLKNLSVDMQDDNGAFSYVLHMGRVVAQIDPYSKTSKLCPNIKSFSMPAAENAINEAQKNQEICTKYNSALEALCDDLNSKLKENLFYDGTLLTFTPILLDKDKSVLDDRYQRRKEEVMQEYDALIKGKMEANLKTNNPYKYIHCYQVAHPEKKALVDSIRLEYRCYSNLYMEIINALEGKPITSTPCREKYYIPSIARLFKDKAEIDERYNRANSEADFENEIKERQTCKTELYSFENQLQRNSKAKVQEMSCAVDGFAQYCMQQINYFKNHYYYDNAIDLVLSVNNKANAEYAKNGHYFENKKAFFEAYISTDYKTVLKDKKK